MYTFAVVFDLITSVKRSKLGTCKDDFQLIMILAACTFE